MKARAYIGRSRTRNYPLSIGVALSVVVLALAIFGPMLAPHDPLKEYGVILIDGTPYGPPPLERPIPPFLDARFPLGTDGTMRDVLSRLLWAVRPTLIMCVVIMLVRLAIGAVLGVLAGWFRSVERVVDAASGVCTAVPLLAVAVAILLGWGLQRGLIGFVVALSLTGWCDTASVVKTRVQMIRRAPYVESAQAIGLRTGGILRRHVLPQLRPFLPILVAFELSAVLLVVAELGYLGYYLGGGAVFEYSIGNADRNFMLRSGTPELGQMLSNFFRNLYRTPWIAIAAGGTVFTMLAAFALVGEGLRRRLDITRPRRARLRLPDPLLDTLSLPRWRWGLAGVASGALVVAGVVVGRQWAHAAAAEVSSSVAPSVSTAITTDASASATATTLFGTTPAAADQLTAIDFDAFIRQPGIVPDNYEVSQVTGSVRDPFRNVPQPIKVANISLKRQGVIAGRVQILLYPDVAQRDAAMQTIVDVVSGRTRYPDIMVVPPPDPVPAAGERSVSLQIRRAPVTFDLVPDPQIIFMRCGAAVWLQLGESGRSGLDDISTRSGLDQVTMAEVAAMAQVLDQQLAPLVCQPGAAPAAQPSLLSSPSSGTAPVSVAQLAAIDLDALIRQPGIVPENYEVSQVSGGVRDQFRAVPKPTKAASIGLKRHGVIAGRVQVLLYPDVTQRDAAMQTMGDAVASSFDPDPQVLFVRCGAAVWLQLGESSQPGLNEGNPGGGLDKVTMAEVAAMAQVLDQQLAPQVCQ